jgi:hypothetical protein
MAPEPTFNRGDGHFDTLRLNVLEQSELRVMDWGPDGTLSLKLAPRRTKNRISSMPEVSRGPRGVRHSPPLPPA